MTLVDFANIGNGLGGLAAVVLAAAAIIGGSAGLGDWRAKQRAQKALAEEEAENIRLNRQRVLNGWSSNGVSVYGVRLVAEKDEIAEAQQQLTAGGPSDYVILRVSENPAGNANRAHNLRQLIETDGYIARAPSSGEYEALEKGRSEILQLGNPAS